jgi:VanZ family protein
MLPPMMTALFRASGMLSLVAIAVLSLVPGETRPHVVWPGSLEHVAAYFISALLLSLGFGDARFAVAPLLSIGFLLTLYGGVLEAAQRFVPGRMPTLFDWGASTAGVWLGVALVWLWRGVARRALR